MGMRNLPSEEQMWRATTQSDASFDGVFVLAVKTTGIFCRPVCTARMPNRENVEFFERYIDNPRPAPRIFLDQ